jgi:polysaccharide biosynthesis protein PslH
VKILFVIPYIPNLIRVRPYNLLVNLAKRGHEITLATLYSSPEEWNDLRRLDPFVKEVVAEPLPRWRSLINSLMAAPTGVPLQSVYCWHPQLARRLRAAAQSKQCFDVVHVEHLRGARYGLDLLNLKRGANLDDSARQLPVVWDSVDCISLLFELAAARSTKRLSRWISRFELRRTKRYEGWLVNQFDRVLVTSINDSAAFQKLASKKIPDAGLQVLPNGVDLEYFSPLGDESEKAPATLVISGKMSYHANVTMVMNFVEHIFPQIQARKPEVKLVLVGKDPAPEIRALAHNPAIHVTGTVEDIRPYLRGATIAVSPIVYGVGIQNKVLEAMACGVPVVSSPQAVSALAVVANRDLKVADGANSFTEAICELLDKRELRVTMGEAGRRYVEEHHSWSKITDQLEAIYNEAIRIKTSVRG